MAKLQALQALNAVLKNIGESTVASLTSLTAIQQLAFDKINEAIDEICTDQTTRWQFLESLGRIQLTNSQHQYQITALSSGSDLMKEDKESFRQTDSGYHLRYITPQEFDSLYPKGITTDVTGYPTKFTKYNGYFVFNTKATSTQVGDYVDFRYWKLPTHFATTDITGLTDIPEPFDLTVIVNLATLKTLAYLGNEEAAIYKAYVYGDGRDAEGSLDKMKELHSSPDLKPRMTYKF